MSGGAVFSPDRVYRYELHRRWDDREPIAFIGLNPSTADETQDDPTIRRCIGFARRLGAGGIVMLNLFAYRATDPAAMKAAPDPVGPANDEYLVRAASLPIVVAAWGVHGDFQDRSRRVANIFPRLHAFGLTRSGQPRHPLYLRGDAPLIEWTDTGGTGR